MKSYYQVITPDIFKNITEDLQLMFTKEGKLSPKENEIYAKRLSTHNYSLNRLKSSVSFFLDNKESKFKQFPTIAEFLKFQDHEPIARKEVNAKELERVKECVRQCWKEHITPIVWNYTINKPTKDEIKKAGEKISYHLAEAEAINEDIEGAFQLWSEVGTMKTTRLPDHSDIYQRYREYQKNKNKDQNEVNKKTYDNEIYEKAKQLVNGLRSKQIH